MTKAKDTQINNITAQIKLLTDTVALLSKSLANKENNSSNSGGGGSSGSGGSGSGGGGLGGIHNFRYTRNMGNYCWSCGHHPVGVKHDSVTYTHKKDRHKDGATATNCMVGDNFWPRKYKVKPSQQEHASYKGKSASN